MKIIDFNVKILERYKMELFNQLIKLVWYDDMDKIDALPKKILDEDIDKKIDEQTILNLIRIILGLNPENKIKTTLKEMIHESINLNEISSPVISVIEDGCKYCDNKKDEVCIVKENHISCNEDNSCSACGTCILKCKLGAISDKIQFIPIVRLLKDVKSSVYAIVAPSFAGQFGEDVTPGKLRTSFKQMGFEDMIEVAFAADILTAKEAYEYYGHMKKKEDGYFITSCCCPIWVSLIQSKFPKILENVSPSVSPMIACGRIIKILNPKAKVVFIGPCTAKKKEATLDDIKDAVDFVLTYKEVEEVFKAIDLVPSTMKEDNRVEASFSGRVYARSGGVSEAIKLSVERIDKDISFVNKSFQGIKECMEGLQKIMDKDIHATFIEGMGCVGGCIGGPKRILNIDEGIKYLDKYCKETNIETPFDNFSVVHFLTLMGIKRIESLGEKEEHQVAKIFSRKIDNSK